MTHFSKATLTFLRQLSRNNNREWFGKHKDRYLAAQAEAKSVLEDIEHRLERDSGVKTPGAYIGNAKLYRIYRDVRFSKNKTPYNTALRMYWGRKQPDLRGGYYLSVSPSEVFLGGGFWNPEREDLQHIRAQIAAAPAELPAVIEKKAFVKVWGEMKGEQLKSSPRGYDKDHPAVEQLRYKQFLFSKTYPSTLATTEDFVSTVVADFGALHPFLDHMTYLLRHDLNGAPL